jgi:seryl-tRNA synthetase
MEELGFPYRVLNMATEELGAAAYRKFDVEVWMPARQAYGEVSSASNCTSYQSRRLNIGYLEHSEKRLAHTVNGTALAVPRIILSILETYYDNDKKIVRIPECLHPFLPFTQIDAKDRPSLIH